MKGTRSYVFLGLITLFLFSLTACDTGKKMGKKKKYSKKCGTCPTWGYDNQNNHKFTFINEEKV
jgi:hypothetical protein